MNLSMLLSSLLFLLASLLLLSVVLELRRRARQVVRRLDGKAPSEPRLSQWLLALGTSRLGQQSVKLDNETQTLLNGLGWRTARKRALYAAFQVGVPVLALALSVLIQELFCARHPSLGRADVCHRHGLSAAQTPTGGGRAASEEKLAIEISTFIPLLRILFESGMAVEQSLRVLSNDGKQLMPTLTMNCAWCWPGSIPAWNWAMN
jgi:tight adherence protein C